MTAVLSALFLDLAYFHFAVVEVFDDVRVVEKPSGSIFAGIVDGPVSIEVDELHVDTVVDEESTHFKVAGCCSVEEAGLAIIILMVNVASCPQEGSSHATATVVPGGVEEGSLREEIVCVEVEVKS